MNLINCVYVFFGLLISLPIGCLIIYCIGMLMNLISDKYKKFEWINSILAILVIIIVFILLASLVIMGMMVAPILLSMIFIMLVIAIIEYFIRG